MSEFLNNFHFLRPYAFLALIPLIYLVIKNYRQHSNSIAHWQKVCDSDLLPYLLENGGGKNTKYTFWLAIFCGTLAIFALAAPTWQRLPAPAFRNNSSLVIVLNLSESMNAQDVKPSRLIRGRYKIADLLSQRKDGQTALIVYSDAAFTVTPLTNDIETIHSQLEALTTDIMPAEGNNTVAALEKAVDLLKQAGLQQGHILLITDSANNAEEFAKKSNYQLSVLGIGTTEGAPIALPEGGFAKDKSGQILIPKLQRDELQKLATVGKGRFQLMTADDSDVKNLLETFDTPVTQMPTDKTNLFLEQWEDNGYWLILLILPWAAWQFRKGAFYLAILFLLPIPKNSYAFDLQNLWKTPDQQAQKIYQKKDYAKAAEKFENPDWKASAQYQSGDFDNAAKHFEHTKNFYNLGNALAKKGELQQALNAYEQAINENPYDNDAKANKEIVEKALEKQKQENKQQDSQKSEQQKNEKSDQDSQKKEGENKESDSKPEQKNEHKAGENPDKKENSKQNEQSNQESEKQEESKEKSKNEHKKDVEAQKITTEQEQANEQWLKRIPDDPATLLKRKFKYQYSQER
jgi:Ca-activated chloride channel family protein